MVGDYSPFESPVCLYLLEVVSTYYNSVVVSNMIRTNFTTDSICLIFKSWKIIFSKTMRIAAYSKHYTFNRIHKKLMEKKIPNIFLVQFAVIWAVANFAAKVRVFKIILNIIVQVKNINANANDTKTSKWPFWTVKNCLVFQSTFDNFVNAIFRMHSIACYIFIPQIFSGNFF